MFGLYPCTAFVIIIVIGIMIAIFEFDIDSVSELTVFTVFRSKLTLWTNTR